MMSLRFSVVLLCICLQAVVQGVNQCEQPKEVGRCRMYNPRFYFNKETSMCEYFIYGGCYGNLNNFRTFKDCEETCVVPQCLQPKKVGRCRAYFPRYYFNTDTSRCEGFNYGGCHGNRNNFETKKDCELACMG